jgi:hypothetical protein
MVDQQAAAKRLASPPLTVAVGGAHALQLATVTLPEKPASEDIWSTSWC